MEMVSLTAWWPFSAHAEPSPSERGGEEGKEGDWQTRQGAGLGAAFRGLCRSSRLDGECVTSSCRALVSTSLMGGGCLSR